MSERKLAHIEVVKNLRPIKGADRIEVAEVLGWECVVKKGEFKVGDLIIYVEVDSIMPEKPEFEFLRDRKFRVKTIKLRKQISQGLVLPLSTLGPSEVIDHLDEDDIGLDVTELLGITKYLSPSEIAEQEAIERRIRNDKNKLRKFMMRYSWFRKLFLSRKKKSGFPYWVSKTDEERIQNMPQVLQQFADKEVYVTEKIDYQSVTFTGKMVPRFSGKLGELIPIKRYQFVVCSRNMTTNNKNSLYWQIAKKYNIEQILRENPTLTIQGEQGDTRVQGNKYGIKEPTMWVFNIIDHEKDYHYNYFEMYEFCKKYNLLIVPILGIEVHNSPFKEELNFTPLLKHLGSSVQELVEFSKGKSVLADIPREGIVVRCIENGKKILSFKVINPDFLLKYD
ncbi:MAG TPA: RNA ligase family protein [Bacteroidales bacterium]|nr:RNA ligase family protein [Bacteroidales bacterium]